jgi:hypothetical protein
VLEVAWVQPRFPPRLTLVCRHAPVPHMAHLFTLFTHRPCPPAPFARPAGTLGLQRPGLMVITRYAVSAFHAQGGAPLARDTLSAAAFRL